MSTPVIIVAGFLGAGKTTLMRRLIQSGHARELKLCVIVNEFGASDVDGHILQEADAELIASVTGGCACCAGQDDFHETLLEVAMRPASEKPDVVLVEASGLADPLLLLDVLTAPDLIGTIRVAAILCVADAGRPDEYSTRSPLAPLLLNQLRLADFILLNKADLCDESTLLVVTETLREIAPPATIFPCTECKVPFDEIWAKLSNSKNPKIQKPKNPTHQHSHTLFVPLPHPVQRESLEAALSNLSPDIWRAKGFLRVRGEEGMVLLQFTGGGKSTPRWRLAPFHLPFSNAEPPLGIVFIGAHFEEEMLRKKFAGLAAFL